MIRIEELHIRAIGYNEEEGKMLTRQLTERLAESIPETVGNVHIPEIRINLQSESKEGTVQIADRIAVQIIRKINDETLFT